MTTMDLELYLRQFDAHISGSCNSKACIKRKELNGKNAALKIIEQVKNTDLKAMIDLF
jgi:hypothetical protein